jgi:hypothetical protein
MSARYPFKPITREERAAYAKLCRELAIEQRKDGNTYSADVNDMLANKYEKDAPQ